MHKYFLTCTEDYTREEVLPHRNINVEEAKSLGNEKMVLNIFLGFPMSSKVVK